jgi:hypothetical protein
VVLHVFAERFVPTAPGAHRKLPVRVKVFLCCLGAVILAGSLVRVLRGVNSDFPLHYAFGKRFVEGTFIYAGGLHVPYPPFWAMFWAPWTLLSLEAAQVFAFLILGIGSLTAFSVILIRIGHRIIPAPDDRITIALCVTLVFAARFILQDLTKSDPNLFL